MRVGIGAGSLPMDECCARSRESVLSPMTVRGNRIGIGLLPMMPAAESESESDSDSCR
jgi:hypothetical protein